jgi:G:T-mismatch repair DNA endonuclease (very short patch repair protein)
VRVIWECETRDPAALRQHLRRLLARYRVRRHRRKIS